MISLLIYQTDAQKVANHFNKHKYTKDIKMKNVAEYNYLVLKLETENARLKKDIDKLVAEISMANRFIKSQKEYYEKLTNKNPTK
jgi:hypothetical protein